MREDAGGRVMITNSEDLVYDERLTSNRTEAFFLVLTVLYTALFAWRKQARKVGRPIGETAARRSTERSAAVGPAVNPG